MANGNGTSFEEIPKYSRYSLLYLLEVCYSLSVDWRETCHKNHPLGTET